MGLTSHEGRRGPVAGAPPWTILLMATAMTLPGAALLGCSSGMRVDPRSDARPTSLEAKVLAYNVLFQYQQLPNDDGSFPAWVCRLYPYVVDHPELRWESRFPAIAATIEAEAPDVLGLCEMRGGTPVSADPQDDDPPQDPSIGPPLIGDMTRWMRDESSVRYAWISVFDLDPAAIELDAREASSWPGGRCRGDQSRNGCRSYDPRFDHVSSKSFLAYRPDRYRVLESGAIETPTASRFERRFAPWARLEDRASGLSFLAVVVHLDPFSGAHRIESVRRIVRLLERFPGVPSVVMGDFNARADAQDECDCSCGPSGACDCPREIMTACRGQSVYRALVAEVGGEPRLLDTFVRAGQRVQTGSTRAFRASGPRWTSEEPCWPERLRAEGRGTAPTITFEETGDRIDYVFTTPDVEVTTAAIVSPRMPTIEVDGEPRTVRPSDHLPVTATLRIGERQPPPEAD